jgi:serine/threonine protein kinase
MTYVLKGGYGDQEIVFIMEKILETLIFLKKNKIIHRDIKPDNIVFKRRNFKLNAKEKTPNLPKLIDFGLSTYTDKGFYIYRRVGSPGFTAPEILNLGAKGPVTYGYMSDIYTAGLIFCFLKTERNPFYHEDKDIVLQRNKDNQINFNACGGKMQPAALEFFKRMVVLNPVDRPTAED